MANKTEQAIQRFIAWRQKFQKQITTYKTNVMPKKIGVTATNFFKQHYQESEWFDGGWRKWKPAIRQSGVGTSARYGTLLSRRNRLFGSISYRATANGAVVYNYVEYAKIHNEGGDISQNITITPKMRKWAWYKYYSTLGVRKGRKKKGLKLPSNPIADKYKGLALTKKTQMHRSIHMPKRPFIYNNAELSRILREQIMADLRSITKMK